MATPKIHEYPIMVDKERHIRFDMNAMIEFEDITGIDMLDSFTLDLFKKPKMIRALLYSCLVHEDPDLDIKVLGKYLNVRSLQDIGPVLRKAFVDAMPSSDNSSEEEGETPLVETENQEQK